MVGVELAEVDALDIAAHLKEALILRGAAQYEGHARGVSRDGAGNGEVLLIGLHIRRRDDYDLMSEEYAGLVALEAADDYAVVADLVNVDVAVAVRLLAGRQGAQALRIGDGDRAAQVVVLDVAQELHEPLVVVRAEVMVHIIGAGTQAGERLRAGAAVRAAADDLGKGAGRAGLAVGVLRGVQPGRCRC